MTRKDAARLVRLRRLRARRRERAAAELATRTAEIAVRDGEIAATRDAESVARTVTTGDVTPAATLVLAWAHADGLARRAMGLLDDRVRALTAAEGARETLCDRWRDEQQLARLAARLGARADARMTSARDRRLDELAIRAHGRKR
jgi:hypothetical protein